MPLTAAQIVSLACQDAKCPGFTSQGGQFLNAALQDYCQNYDLEAALGNYNFTFNSAAGQGSGPYTLPADYLRTRVQDGKDEFFYVLNGVPYPLIQCTLTEYNWMVQTPGFSSYPYNYATDLSASPPQLFVWPPASGSYACTMRYFRLMPDIATPETSATVPWFLNTMILQRDVAGRLMGLTGDSRQADYLGDDEAHPLGVGNLMRKYLRNVEDREGAVHTVGRDRRRFGRTFDLLKNTKSIGWAIAFFALAWFMLAAPEPAHANCTTPCTKAQITTDITTNWPDNTGGAITPALLRSTVLDLVNSYVDTGSAGNLTCAASQWIAAIATLSTITCTQPAFTDITGQVTLVQLPTIAANTGLCSIAGGTPIACTKTQLTTLINLATASLSGALPAWPNNTTTYFRGDGTYVTNNCAALTNSGPYCAATLGQLPGTTTNDSASAGNIGEIIKSVITQGSAISLTSPNASNITSISLTAGDWDLYGSVNFVPGATTSITFLNGSASTSSGNPGDFLDDQPGWQFATAAMVPTASIIGQNFIGHVKLSGTTTYYLVARGGFSISTLTAFGYIEGKRTR